MQGKTAGDAMRSNAADQELIKRILSGDESAFESLRGKYHYRIYALCLRLAAGNKADAEEIEQDTFLSAFRGLDKFGGRSCFYTWLYRIAINCFLMRRRKEKNGIVTVPIDEIRYSSDESSGIVIQPEDGGRVDIYSNLRTADIGRPDRNLESLPLKYLLAEVMEGMPPGYLENIILRDYEGLDFEEIAEIKGYNVGTAKSQHTRGLARLLIEVVHLCKIPVDPSASLKDLRKKLGPIFAS